jgi:hypothetical protein
MLWGIFMDIQRFLIENLVDTYCNYCECVIGISSNEFDQQFYNDEGEELSDLAFILKNHEDIFIDEVFDGLYGSIVDFGAVKEIDLNKVVAFLASRYYVYNYNNQANVISYLKQNKLDDIVNLFINNYHFGMDLVKSYFFSLIDSKRYDDNRKNIYENNDQEGLLTYEKECEVVKVTTIHNILREVVCNLYNYYISIGCSDIDALNYTWYYFISDIDPLNELEAFGVDERTKQSYKVYALRLICSDLYEDVCNESIIQSENYNDRLADLVPVVSVQAGVIGVHAEEGIRNRMLKHFILLQEERNKRKKNREKTFNDGRVKQLKKVNPFYQLDELTF